MRYEKSIGRGAKFQIRHLHHLPGPVPARGFSRIFRPDRSYKRYIHMLYIILKHFSWQKILSEKFLKKIFFSCFLKISPKIFTQVVKNKMSRKIPHIFLTIVMCVAKHFRGGDRTYDFSKMNFWRFPYTGYTPNTLYTNHNPTIWIQTSRSQLKKVITINWIEFSFETPSFWPQF